MKLLILLIVIAVASFLIGRFSKRPPIYHADERKVIVKMWSFDYDNKKEVMENFEWSIDSTHEFTFFHTQELRVLIKGTVE